MIRADCEDAGFLRRALSRAKRSSTQSPPSVALTMAKRNIVGRDARQSIKP